MPGATDFYENDWNCPDHPHQICGCLLSVGEMQIRRGALCSVDARGRLYIRATRAADVMLARRVVAAVKHSAERENILTADIVGLREKS